MVIRKAVLSIVVMANVLVTCPMEHDAKNALEQDPKLKLTHSVSDNCITGEMFAVPVNPTVPSKAQRSQLFASDYAIVPKPENQGGLWFKIEVGSPGHNSWEIMRYPWANFPAWLPMTCLLREDNTLKTDGEHVQLTHMKDNTTTRILLTLSQLGNYSLYKDKGKFDQYIAWLLTRKPKPEDTAQK